MTTKVLGYIEKGKFNSHHDWKHRFKENSERMRTGSLIEVAAVLKSLVALSRTKPLSFREKKMLERAKYLLISELATARNASAQTVETMLVKSLAKAHLRMPTPAKWPKPESNSNAFVRLVRQGRCNLSLQRPDFLICVFPLPACVFARLRPSQKT